MIEVIPAIDIIEGACVRLSEGAFETKKVYDKNPGDVAKRFEDAGFSRLHVVDLDGAKTGTISNLHVLEAITSQTMLSVDFGGGIKTERDLRSIFNAGAAQASIGSLAVKEEALCKNFFELFGPERIIIAADTKAGKIQVRGWQEETNFSVSDLITSYLPFGLKEVIVTDIERDGMLAGPAAELYRHLQAEFPSVTIIASGGVSSEKDIKELERSGIKSVIVGKAFYEGRIGW